MGRTVAPGLRKGWSEPVSEYLGALEAAGKGAEMKIAGTTCVLVSHPCSISASNKDLSTEVLRGPQKHLNTVAILSRFVGCGSDVLVLETLIGRDTCWSFRGQ